jgi:four helix bundle protein
MGRAAFARVDAARPAAARAEIDMNSESNALAATPLTATELAIDIIASLRGVYAPIRAENERLAGQLLRSAAGIVTCLAEAFEREGRGRLRFLRIAAGRAEQTQVYLQIAQAWGWVQASDVQATFDLIERELATLSELTR